MLHRQFVFRQLTRSKKQAVLFVLCVALSMITLVALNGFSESVNRLLKSDARKLHAADIIVRSRFPISPQVSYAVSLFEEKGLIKSARTYEFYTVVRRLDESGSLLSSIKVVSPGYPFYGRVGLRSGRSLAQVLKPGHIVVEQNLLNRMRLDVGDRLRVGKAVLSIDDILETEPDRPVSFFAFGPRIMISAGDLSSLDLVQKRSRVRYKMLIRIAESEDMGPIADRLKAASLKEQERIDTFRTADSRVKRFFDNLFFFLKLVGLFTLMLAGIGIYSSLTALLREKEHTIAIMKTLGATGKFVMTQFFAVLFLLGLLGTITGMAAGLWLQQFLPVLFSGLLPEQFTLSISWKGIAEGFCLGLVVVVLFAFLPVYRLKDIRPAAILRKETIRLKRSLPTYVAIAIILLFFMAMVLLNLDEWGTSLYFIGGILGLVLLTSLISVTVLWLMRGIRITPLVPRQALKGLFRPGNATRPMIITLTAALTFVFSIYLIEENLDRQFVQSYPPDAPNLFVLDIQRDQVEAFSRTLGTSSEFYPIVRARVLSVNGKKIDRDVERKRRGDNFARTFNLTYRHHLLDDEVLSAGKGLFHEKFEGVPVSILDTVAEMADPPLKIGDRLTFKIQGIPLEATVTSVRTRVKASIKPFFYFVFPDRVLQHAPHTVFTALNVEKDRIPQLQNRLVAKFPNLTVIDVTASIEIISAVLKRLSRIIRFFTVFSILASLLIVISSVFATRLARIKEAVYYKILGAGGFFVLKVFALENVFLGCISGTLALLMSQVGSWAICRFVIDIPYHPVMGAGVVMIGATMAAVLTAGLIPAISILRKKPVRFLREQTDE